ncbi:hypothetical protein D9M72_497910 [compost metagenome]
MENVTSPPRFPRDTEGRLRMVTAASGWDDRASMFQKTTDARAAAASRPRVQGEVQPSRSTEVTPRTRARRPRVRVIAPGTSSFCLILADRSWITNGARARMMIPTGTLMKKVKRHPKRSVRTPPRTAPTAKPRDSRAPLRPRALLRSGPSSKEVVRRDSAAGMVMAVARP